MDARTLSIREMFSQDRRHVVPLFQRPYVWTRVDQWEPLWEDITSVTTLLLEGKACSPHFLGAIVLDQVRMPTGRLETRLIIDGQQRLTTIQVLLQAFCDVCAARNAERHQKSLLKLTRNDDPMSEDPDEAFKVWPTNVDQEHFRRVMRAASLDELRQAYRVAGNALGHPLADAYCFFFESISDWLSPQQQHSEIRLDRLFDTIRDLLKMVVIDLGREDDPQVIFETLNARGTPLWASDLVKNYLFHRARLEGASQEALYTRYWRPFDVDHEYWRAKIGVGRVLRPRLDVFLHNFLTFRKADDVPIGHLYTTFREWSKEGAATAEHYLADFNRYAAVFRSFDDMEPHSRVGLFFRRLQVMETTTAYPFLLELFGPHPGSPDDLSAIVSDLESFLVRRLICHLTTKNYNRLFLDLLGALRGTDGTPVSRVRRFLSSQEGDSTRWPSDDEFREAWLEHPVFRQMNQRRLRMVLEALERQLYTGMTEQVDVVETLTIEHLIPQEWRRHWPLPSSLSQEEAERRRERALHTIGNLTLLTARLNPSISNEAWENKRKSILDHSRLALNRQFQEQGVWNEDEIARRGTSLFQLALEVWPHPA